MPPDPPPSPHHADKSPVMFERVKFFVKMFQIACALVPMLDLAFMAIRTQAQTVPTGPTISLIPSMAILMYSITSIYYATNHERNIKYYPTSAIVLEVYILILFAIAVTFIVASGVTEGSYLNTTCVCLLAVSYVVDLGLSCFGKRSKVRRDNERTEPDRGTPARIKDPNSNNQLVDELNSTDAESEENHAEADAQHSQPELIRDMLHRGYLQGRRLEPVHTAGGRQSAEREHAQERGARRHVATRLRGHRNSETIV